MRVASLVVAVFAAGCNCQTRLDSLDVKLSAPATLQLPDTYVGASRSAVLQVQNSGGANGDVVVAVAAPFRVSTAHLIVPAHGAAQVPVTFSPTTSGPANATLTLGQLHVAVSGDGLAPASCLPTACTTSQFDPDAGGCVETSLADGTACTSGCLSDGRCEGGVCVGTTSASCDDGDACTLDGCATDGTCTHQPQVCPDDPAHCLAPACDADAGCAMAAAADGTLCGPDDCLATTVQVCIAGACVSRPRPAGGRCANTWVPVLLPPRTETAVAYDAARKKVVLFGGTLDEPTALDDTWEWDGQRWDHKTPTASPPARCGHAMAYDPIRQRVVLFGGQSSIFGPPLGEPGSGTAPPGCSAPRRIRRARARGR